MSNFFQNVGMFLCVGALILVGLAMFAAMRRRNAAPTANNRPVYDEDDRVFNEQGTARPQYDDREIKTAGGFGVPSTGSTSSRPSTGGFGARDYGDNDRQQQNDGGFMDLDDRLRNRDSSSTPNRPSRKRDDDDIRSSGGFGG